MVGQWLKLGFELNFALVYFVIISHLIILYPFFIKLFHFLIPGQLHFVIVLAPLGKNTKLHYLQLAPLYNTFPLL